MVRDSLPSIYYTTLTKVYNDFSATPLLCVNTLLHSLSIINKSRALATAVRKPFQQLAIPFACMPGLVNQVLAGLLVAH